MKTLDTPHDQPALRLTGGAHRPAAHQPESRPTRGLDPRQGAATARASRAATASGGGAMRCGEVEPKRGRGGAHEVEGMAASLTGYLEGGKQRRRGGAASRGGGGRTGAAAALQGRGRGQIRRGTGRGGVGDAPPRRIGAALTEGGESRRRRSSGAVAAMEVGNG